MTFHANELQVQATTKSVPVEHVHLAIERQLRRPRSIDPQHELEVHCETESKKTPLKKKKNKKDLTAGLIIPSSLGPPLKKKTSGNKDKLKHLLADTERIKKKTSLQDFLQNI